MSDLSRELQRFATSKPLTTPEPPSRVFIKLTMRSGEIETWIDTDEICSVEQLDGWCRVRGRHGDTWSVTESAVDVLTMMRVAVIEHFTDV